MGISMIMSTWEGQQTATGRRRLGPQRWATYTSVLWRVARPKRTHTEQKCIQQAAFIRTYAHTYVCMHVTIIKEKEAANLKVGEHERGLREGSCSRETEGGRWCDSVSIRSISYVATHRYTASFLISFNKNGVTREYCSLINFPIIHHV